LDNFWDDHYLEFSENSPTPFCRDVLAKVILPTDTVVELGCGNGRDGLWILRNCSHYVGVDLSEQAIATCKQRFEASGIASKKYDLIMSSFADYDFETTSQSRLVVYSRFSLHSDTEQAENDFLKNLSSYKAGPLLVFVEVRTVYDELFGLGNEVARNSFVTDHFRRFIVPEELRRKVEDQFTIVSFEVSKDFAPYQTENPKVLRLVFSNESK
jgi:tellurite methyltransferase